MARCFRCAPELRNRSEDEQVLHPGSACTDCPPARDTKAETRLTETNSSSPKVHGECDFSVWELISFVVFNENRWVCIGRKSTTRIFRLRITLVMERKTFRGPPKSKLNNETHMFYAKKLFLASLCFSSTLPSLTVIVTLWFYY